MSSDFVPFDDIRSCVGTALDEEPLPPGTAPVYAIRDLFGKLRISVSEEKESNGTWHAALQRLAGRLSNALGARGYPQDQGVLFVDPALLKELDDSRQELRPGVYLAERLVTGQGWWTAGASDGIGSEASRNSAARVTLYSVKGGVGRSTTAVVLAWHLARKGERVLAVDLDLESPGLSSAMLEGERRPRFGVTDWFVEGLVGQGDRTLEDMLAAPAWAQAFDGDVRVAPAHGADPGEYMAKLGRVYMDTKDDPWTARLERLLGGMETIFEPTIVLMESRSGLHDIAAATVTDLDAEVLLFATDSDSGWTDYRILFHHWQDHNLAPAIRERLSIVSALTPEVATDRYVLQFRERAWNLFQEHLYDSIEPLNESGDAFSFALAEEGAPHDPLVIHWNRGLAAGASLLDPAKTSAVRAYEAFLERFDRLVGVGEPAE